VRVRKLANALKSAGIKKGDRVATIAWNNYRHIEIYYAVSSIGAIVHTINPRLKPEQIAWMVNHAEDTMLMFDTTFGPIVDGVSAACPTVKKWVCNPKGVLYSHRSTILHAMAGSMNDVIGGGAKDTILAVVPMFHVSAWGLVYSGAMVGAKLVMPGPGLDGANMCKMINQEKVTLMAGVPTVWLGIYNHAKANGIELPTVKKALVGGSALPESLLRAYELAGRRIFGVDMRIVDDEDKELPQDGEAEGHLHVREKWQERPFLIVQAAPGKNPDKEEIKACITKKCAKWWLPDEIIFQDTLPLGATGKVLKRELKDIYKDRYTK